MKPAWSRMMEKALTGEGAHADSVGTLDGLDFILPGRNRKACPTRSFSWSTI
ncbi:hypothetical protein C8P63_13130 [Melghirimyces profundicolus]|uniref:Uncharacterized protein n=1 Tax=Melghirimyces profundicolus TaxID=1242148 RepID=A0A2T6B834_9BACL|nr:hypothetical protein [Melghirimyces profundicolus]PTX52214.1 hypothetical protein C8P63_13130 [Melghirimyces profundicolus]